MSAKTYMQSMEALGTNVELRVVAVSTREAEETLEKLWEQVVQFENTFSRFLFDSELSLFNARAGEKVYVSEMFTAILERTQYFSVLTEGLFNPFILPRLQQFGYQHSMTDLDNEAPDYTTCHIEPYTALEVGENWARIPKNSAIDLGGIGKGFLADFLGSCVRKPIESYCLSLGGDMAVKGKNESGNFWSIDIQSSRDREKVVARFEAETDEKVGVATSGMVRGKSGKQQTHQIHPDENDTVRREEYDLCSVVAHDATTADVLASMVLLGGVPFAQRMLENGSIQGAILQKNKNKDTPLLIGQGFSLI